MQDQFRFWIDHDDVMKWEHLPRYWPFVRGIHRSPVNFSHKGQWRGALMFSLIFAWIHGWVYNREAGDLGRHLAHYDVILLRTIILKYHKTTFHFLQLSDFTPHCRIVWRLCCWIPCVFKWDYRVALYCLFYDWLTIFAGLKWYLLIRKLRTSRHSTPRPLYWNGLTSIPKRMSTYVRYKVWGEIAYPFRNFKLNGTAVDGWEFYRSCD